MNVKVKEVSNYEGLYIIDSLGNVVSLPKMQGNRLHNKYKILSTKLNRSGYLEVSLSKEGKLKTFLLHRLIATHFIDNPNGYKYVNHKNGIKVDNRIENLEWCTMSQNTKHAYDNNLGDFRNKVNAGIAKMNEYTQYIKVVLISPSGEEITFNSAIEAAEYLGTKADEVTRAIRKSQRVKKHLAYGFKKTPNANGETLP